MTSQPLMSRRGRGTAHRGSSAHWLAAAWAALVVYASLYPFAGWRWPPGQEVWTLLALPHAIHQDAFDITSNLLGYTPLGLLLAVGLHRPGRRAWHTAALVTLLGSLLSYICEVGQHFVPGRVPAREDLGMNVLGNAAGALLGLALHALGWIQGFRQLRQRWLAEGDAVLPALLLLWPVGLLFPTPVPLGLGQVGDRLRETLASWLEGVPWAVTAHAWLDTGGPAPVPLRPLSELLIVALGLLAPCLLAYSITAPGLRRLVFALGALTVGVGGMTLSTLLNFGPAHAWSWITAATLPGLGLGLLAALLLTPVPSRLAAVLALMVLTGSVAAVAQAPADPYFAQSLRAWEQGRFVRFHGLAQWVGWLWPYAAMIWLLARVANRAHRP